MIESYPNLPPKQYTPPSPLVWTPTGAITIANTIGYSKDRRYSGRFQPHTGFSPFASLQKHRHSRESGNPDERRELCFSSPPSSRGWRENRTYKRADTGL